MDTEIKTTDKFQELENDIQELNSLVELTFISNQYSDIDEFLAAVKSFISKHIKNSNVHFLYSDLNNVLRSTSGDEYQIHINPLEDDIYTDLLKFPQENQCYKISEHQNKKEVEIFYEKYNFTELKPECIKVFAKSEWVCAVCLISKKLDESEYSFKEMNFLGRIFSFIDPILQKYIKKSVADAEISDLHKTLNKISILYSISQAVNFIDDLKRLLKIVLTKALDTLQAEKASLMFYDYADNSLQIKFVFGLSDKNIEADINNGLIECTKIKISEGIAGSVFAQKKSIICNLGQNDPRFYSSHESSHTNSLLCVPLIAKGEAIGVINITNKKGDRLFTRADLEFMEALANQAAIAIDNAKLYELATKDGLTKLYIYRHFYTLLENELRRAARYEHPMTILMMDIDNFKKVNDTFGHLVGDQVLREVASVISNSIRKIDIAARYGGEEFAIILPETCANDAKIIANRVRDNISKISVNVREGINICPTVSVGMSEFPSCAEDEVTLLELADIALYQSKAAGKNIVYEYTPFGCQMVDLETGLTVES